MASSADEYLRSAQQIVMRLQEQVVVALQGEDRWDLRHAGLDELVDYMQLREEAPPVIQRQRQLLSITSNLASHLSHPPAPMDIAPVPAADIDSEEDCDSPYFMTTVGSKRLRRLHRRNACGVSQVDVQVSEPLWSLKGVSYDLACKHCWKPGENVTVSEAEEADDSDASNMIWLINL